MLRQTLRRHSERNWPFASIGSFSQDPIGFAAGDANLYRYVGNGPTNATDPSGFVEEFPKFNENSPDYVEPGVRQMNETERAAAALQGKAVQLPPLAPFNPYTNKLRGHYVYPIDGSGRCWQNGRDPKLGLPPTPIYVPGTLVSGGTRLTMVANEGHVYIIVETPDGHQHSYGAYPGGQGIGNVEVDSDLKWPSHAKSHITYVLTGEQEKALAAWINAPWTYVNDILKNPRSVCIDYAENAMDHTLRSNQKIVDGELGWPQAVTVGGVISEIERRKNYRRHFQKMFPQSQPTPAPPVGPSGTSGGGTTKDK